MVKQAAHDSLDECSIHSSLNVYVIIIFLRKIPFDGMTGWAVNSIAFAIKGSIPFLPNYMDPNAEIGRQNELKLRWYNVVKVQILFRIHRKCVIIYECIVMNMEKIICINNFL